MTTSTTTKKKQATKATSSALKTTGKRKAVRKRAPTRLPPGQRLAQTVTERAVVSSRDLLQAGLNALSLPRAESAMADGLSKIADSFGFKKLEDVFDQRVASALERIGMPSAAELLQLREKVEVLSAIIQQKSSRPRR